MRRSVAYLVPLLIVVTSLAGGCSKEPAPPSVEQPTTTMDPSELTAFSPLPDAVPAASGAAAEHSEDS